jgi:hypothetical protein
MIGNANQDRVEQTTLVDTGNSPVVQKKDDIRK